MAESLPSPIRRVMAVVDLDSRGREVARRGWRIASVERASFALLTVADWGIGEDDFCPYTPAELEAQLEPVLHRKLARLAAALGAREAVTRVAFTGAGFAVAAWQPDLVVVGAHARHGLADGPSEVAGWTCTVLAMDVGRPWLNLAGRLLATGAYSPFSKSAGARR
ncbi:MAG: universal stress protein [Magnetospirillum sp.]|nr:universal stress protein [Magnetospirillum sp.]